MATYTLRGLRNERKISVLSDFAKLENSNIPPKMKDAQIGKNVFWEMKTSLLLIFLEKG